MLDFLLSHLPEIGTLISALFGGGLVTGLMKAYQTYYVQHRKNDQQQHDQNLELSGRLENLLDKERGKREAMEKRLDTVEERLDEERERRLQAERQNELLQRKLDLVIRLLNDMREKQGMERLSEDDIALIAVNDTGPNGGKESNG